MNEKIKAIQKKIIELPENTLTKDYIVPLFESLGYFKVEFYGGTNEKGKDILCWEKDKLGEVKLYVAQVKHFKFTNKASDSRSFQTIINQLIACFAFPIPLDQNNFFRPSEVWLISSHTLDSKTIESRFSEHSELYNRRIKIIDGLKLSELLLEKRTDLVSKLLGVENRIHEAIVPILNNQTLMKALGVYPVRDIRTFYIDISFSLGKNTTKLFFALDYSPVEIKQELDNKDWSDLKRLFLQIGSEYFLKDFEVGIEKIENEYENQLINYEKWKKEHELKIKEVDQISLHVKEIRAEVKKRNELSKETLKSEIKKYETSLEIASKELNKILQNMQIKPSYKVLINGHLFARTLIEKRNFIEQKIALYHQKKPEKKEIIFFIRKCKDIIDGASMLFSNKLIFNALSINEKIVYRGNFESTRMELPIHEIFDSGLNIAVLGEAGAGKTTCLQMYALNGLNYSDKLFVWIPLSGLSDFFLDNIEQMSNKESYKFLIESIAGFLTQRGVSITLHEFEQTIASQPVVLLLDGIDEVIKSAPWLLRAIRTMSEEFTSLQMITSSRMSGTYLNEIPFFSVTLLPFTDKQRNQFIEKWFEKEDKSLIIKVKNHLDSHKAVSDAIKNPLLITTLCVIAKSGLPLPNTELKLYESRLNLLTGYYDNVKNIKSRISNTPNDLQEIAKKLAFKMHCENKREFSLVDENLLNHLNKEIFLEKEQISKAIKELIDPCNLLVPMTEDGKFGFGHLRYQEYLVAKEIATNRGVQVSRILKNTWWKGVLVLFIRMNSDIKWLIHELGLKNEITNYKNVLVELIDCRPEIERKDLKSLLSQYLKLEQFNNNTALSDLES